MLLSNHWRSYVNFSVRSFVVDDHNGRLFPFVDKLAWASIDLSNSTRLKDLVFLCTFDPYWIATTLQTITHNHGNLQRVSVIVPEVLYRSSLNRPDPADIIHAVGETIYQEWLEVDDLLAQLCETHSIHPEVLYNVPPSMDGTRARRLMESLFPELTARGLARLTERQ